MDTTGITVVIPFFAIMVTGFAAGKMQLLPAGSAEIFSRFVFTIAMPAVIFLAVSRVAVADFFNMAFIGALGGSMLIMFGAAMLTARILFKTSYSRQIFHGLTAMYSSTAYIGLPLLLIVFGDQVLAPGVIGAVITGMIFSPLAIVLLELSGNATGHKSFLQPVVSALLKPPVLATFAGLAVSGIGLEIPVIVVRFCEAFGGAFVPCALFAAGLFTASCVVGGASATIGWLVMAKLIIHPLVAWWLAYEVFELEGILPLVVVIQAALPCGVPVFVLAQHYRSFVTESSAVIAVSTALSVFTLSILLILLGV